VASVDHLDEIDHAIGGVRSFSAYPSPPRRRASLISLSFAVVAGVRSFACHRDGRHPQFLFREGLWLAGALATRFGGLGAGRSHLGLVALAERAQPTRRAVLKRHARAEHQALQPLWERRTRGRRTVLLSHPVSTNLTVQDLPAEDRTPASEVLGELTDSRLLAMLRGLEADENTLARAWAASVDTWHEAALSTGLPAGYGERVRRKLKRLGKRYVERRANTTGLWFCTWERTPLVTQSGERPVSPEGDVSGF
jgi:hypothetical protein